MHSPRLLFQNIITASSPMSYRWGGGGEERGIPESTKRQNWNLPHQSTTLKPHKESGLGIFAYTLFACTLFAYILCASNANVGYLQWTRLSFLILMKLKLFDFSLVACAFCIMFKKPSPNPRSWNLFLSISLGGLSIYFLHLWTKRGHMLIWWA